MAALPSALTASEDPAFTREVLAKLKPGPAGHQRWPWVAGLAAAALLMVGVLAHQGAQSSNGGEFTARGGAGQDGLSQPVGFTAFVHPASAPGVRHQASPRNQTIHLDDGFSFELQNRTGKALFAALFAVDSTGETHWFYPSLTEEGADPSAMAVSAQPSVLALPDGITPESVASGKLTLVGVFLGQPVHVSEIELLLRTGGLDGLGKQLPDATIQTLTMNAVQEKAP